jgi:hypothetical protein
LGNEAARLLGREQNLTKLRNVLLACGILSSLLYVFIDVRGGTSWKGYSFASQPFSDLPAMYSPVRQLVLPFIIVRGVLLFGFAFGVWVSAGRNRALRVTALMLTGDNVVGLVTPIFFPPPSSLHVSLTGVEIFFILLSMGFGAAAYRNWFRFYSISTILMLLVLGALTFSQAPQVEANQPTPWLGLMERILIYGYLFWMAALAFVLLRAERS